MSAATQEQTPGAAARRVSGLLDRLRIVRDEMQYRSLLQRLADPAGTTVLSFFNQHAFNLAWTDPDFAGDLRRSDVLLRDGVGIAACLRLLARDPGLNANGTDLIPQLLAAFSGRRAVLIGTREPYLQRASQRLREDYGIDVTCALDGFGEASCYLEAVARERPELVVLAMGMPKQERVAADLAQWAHSAGQRLLIINGGAIADFIAGRVARAPAWMRRARLEWLYRLGREPRRLWRRYLLGGVAFGARALRLAADPPRSAPGVAPSIEGSSMKADTPALFGIEDARVVQLVQRLDASASAGGGRIVQFVAARVGEGTTALAHSYAAASAQLRKRRVLLLSDDVEDETVCFPQAGALAAPGLALARLTHPQRDFRDNYAALDDAAAWHALASGFDEVVLDAQAPYALAAAKHAAGVVVVVEAEATRAAQVRALLDELAAIDARVIGIVLNKYRSHLPHALYERL